MIKPQMEARANDLDRGIDDGSANSSSDGGLSIIPGSDGSAEAGAVQLQLQGCGGSTECTNKSNGSQTESGDSNTASPSTSGHRPKADRAVLSGWSDAGRKGI